MTDPAATADEDLPQRFAKALAERFGDRMVAVLLYGSWLRGSRDTVLDFYVLLDDYDALGSRLAALSNRLLPPNVYHLVLDTGGERVAAKYATVTLAGLEDAVAHDFHGYFWARFAQPFVVVQARSPAIVTRLETLRERAAQRMITEVADLLDETFSTTELWRHAFAATYACELRSEPPGRGDELARRYAEELQTMTARLAPATGLAADGPARWRRSAAGGAQARARRRWWLRRAYGKALSVARLLKAAFTFNDPLDYVVWKVERHSGVREEPTPLQRRHPLLFAWGLLWRLYRRGGFR